MVCNNDGQADEMHCFNDDAGDFICGTPACTGDSAPGGEHAGGLSCGFTSEGGVDGWCYAGGGDAGAGHKKISSVTRPGITDGVWIDEATCAEQDGAFMEHGRCNLNRPGPLGAFRQP